MTTQKNHPAAGQPDSFDRYPGYYGSDLELTYTPQRSVFTLWAPTADKVRLNLYASGEGGEPEERLEMRPSDDGTWRVAAERDLKGTFYTFQIEKEGKWLDETPGIWAKAVGVNGDRAAVIDLRETDPEGWEADRAPELKMYSDIILYELHHRDFSVAPDSGIENKGKFLALTETGTKTPQGEASGLDHLKELGVTHIHILPSFDYATVDEARLNDKTYNWGYDPKNYNVPEGSYSTDPADPAARIREFKQMVQSLHRNGMRIVLDVVYNHTASVEHSNFNLTVPGYFYRHNADGSYSDASGCGNETASERAMVRHYIVESVKFWAKEYHIDGFRFDLMGLYDVETMNLLRAELDQLPGGRNILMYGEPWQGGVSALHRYEANKNNLAMLNERIGIFCDNTRDAIKGGCFDAREPGYVEGKPGSFWDIGAAVAAWCRSDRLPPHAPSQIVSYVSAHDNFTLWDKLLCVRYEKPEFTAADGTALAQNRLAAGIYLTCMGMPFMQAGEEFARTKKGQGNTYRSSPSLNRLDWKRAAQFHGLVDYYRGLLGLRAQFPRLSASDAASPAAIKFFSLVQPLVGWTLPAAPGDSAAWRALCVFYNPTEEENRVRLPDGQWKLLSDGVSSALWKGPSRVCGGEVTLLPYSATIFGQV